MESVWLPSWRARRDVAQLDPFGFSWLTTVVLPRPPLMSIGLSWISFGVPLSELRLFIGLRGLRQPARLLASVSPRRLRARTPRSHQWIKNFWCHAQSTLPTTASRKLISTSLSKRLNSASTTEPQASNCAASNAGPKSTHKRTRRGQPLNFSLNNQTGQMIHKLTKTTNALAANIIGHASERPKFADNEKVICPVKVHAKAVDLHVSAAKSHRAAAEQYGKNEHMRDYEHASEAQKHSKVAGAASDEAHAKSSSKKQRRRGRSIAPAFLLSGHCSMSFSAPPNFSRRSALAWSR